MKVALSQDLAAKIMYGGICATLMEWRKSREGQVTPDGQTAYERSVVS